jgi:hypothetical protein
LNLSQLQIVVIDCNTLSSEMEAAVARRVAELTVECVLVLKYEREQQTA